MPQKRINEPIEKSQAKRRATAIWPILKKTYPDAKIALNFSSPLELLIATILSAQCTDVRVNLVTPALFKKYKTARHFALADPEQLQQDIKSTGFFRNKAKNIRAACRIIDDQFQGKVPGNMEQLLTLPGVGRKTANVILGNAYDTPGITCDTHVIRLSNRIGLSETADPVKLEFDLAAIVPKNRWTMFSHLLIWHGRGICKARKPACDICPIAKHCLAFQLGKCPNC